MEPLIRPMTPADADAVLALNAANVPEVGPMDQAKFDLLLADSPHAVVVELDGAVVGLLIGLVHGSSYGSSNYAWFVERHGDRFAYVDRVALAEAARGRGLGRELYRRFEAWARGECLGWLCAEVNTVPPNPRSLRFHEVYGFVGVEHRKPYGGDEEVVMLEKRLD